MVYGGRRFGATRYGQPLGMVGSARSGVEPRGVGEAHRAEQHHASALPVVGAAASARRASTAGASIHARVRLAREEGQDLSSQYGRRDETCPVSTGGSGGWGLRPSLAAWGPAKGSLRSHAPRATANLTAAPHRGRGRSSQASPSARRRSPYPARRRAPRASCTRAPPAAHRPCRRASTATKVGAIFRRASTAPERPQASPRGAAVGAARAPARGTLQATRNLGWAGPTRG